MLRGSSLEHASTALLPVADVDNGEGQRKQGDLRENESVLVLGGRGAACSAVEQLSIPFKPCADSRFTTKVSKNSELTVAKNGSIKTENEFP